jgi:L-threonylcarbamoyladenylate synthase
VSAPEGVDEVLAALSRGEVVAVPTDTVYGLAADPRRPGATGRLFAAKGRPEAVALPVLVADVEDLARLAEPLPPTARALVARWWPGPLTVVVRRALGVDWELGGDPTTIGVRCPDHGLLRALLRRSGPLAVTSANPHGEPPCATAAEVRARLGEDLVVLDGGRCAGVPSTVVDCSAGTPRLLRPGPVPFEGEAGGK